MNLSRLSQGNSSASNPTSLVWIIVGGLAIIVGGVLIATLAPVILPPQASAESRQVDDLFRFMLAIGGAVFLLVQGLLVYSIVRFRAKEGERADGPPIHGNATLELVWTIIPAILVTLIAIYSFVVYQDITSVKPNEQQVGAVGARYAWTFNYAFSRADLPADVDITTLPENIQADLTDGDGTVRFSHPQLHTWVGQPVDVVMNATDVNHAFWIPAMRVKQDLLVGRETNVRFTPIEAGVYRVVCAELCGAGHGNMAGTIAADGTLQGAWLVVHPDRETFLNEFYNQEISKIINPPDDPVLLGRQILNSGAYPCATCHILDDLGWAGNIGPTLNLIGSQDRINRRLGATGFASMEEYLVNSIRHPGDYLVPGYGNLMPQFNPSPDQPNYMSDADLEAIVAYLLSQNGEAQ